MTRILSVLAALACGISLCAQGSPGSTAPAYTQVSIVNSATSTAGALAPNTIATIYGNNLSDGSTTSATGLLPGAMLMQEMGGTQVFVAGQPAGLYYVSPQQINFLVPADLRPGEMDLFVACDGVAGPQMQITLQSAGPGLFESEPGVVIATHADGSLITKAHPAHAGETVAVYGTGFGETTPNVVSGMVSMTPAQLSDLSDFHVLVNGNAVPAASVLYAGVTISAAGLYQATFKLPKPVASNPEIRVTIADQQSQPDLHLPLQ